MKTIKQFIIETPARLELKHHKQIAKAAELIFDYEINNKQSEFAKKENQSLEDRFYIFFKMIEDTEKKDDLNYVKDVLKYASIRHDKKEDLELRKRVYNYNPENFKEMGFDNEVKGSYWN